MSLIKVYQPKYYKSFSCTGSQCKNNCCHDWQIEIDKITYDKYMSLDEETKNEFDKKLRIVKNQQHAACILMNSDKTCSFLDKKGLCTIQLRFGHDYLSETCRTYPRVFCLVGGSPECFLELSCEVAARLILFDKDYMNFEEKIVEKDDFVHEGFTFNFNLDGSRYSKNEKAMDIFWKLRVANIAILQTRRYTVRFRMLILCLFMQEAAELFKAGNDTNVILLADNYINRLDTGYYNDLAAEMPHGAGRETDIVLDILREMCTKRFSPMLPFILKAKEAFDMDANLWTAPEDFDEKYTRYYDMYFADKEYIFENYLVHRVLIGGFPFNYKTKTDVLSNYVDMLAKYNIVEFLFTGICRSCMKFDKRQIIDCISLFTRGYDHMRGGYLKAEE